MSSPVKQGDLVAGKYRVDRVLGEGGMGIVVAATHEQLDQKVALKFLLPGVSSQPEIVQRFVREARAAVKIHSEHVARVLDVGTLEDGTPFMVMEYLEGEDVAQVVASRGPLPVAESVGWMLEACEAIAEAHSIGIVHRDLKPANLFLAKRPTGRPIVKVLDFGISKVASSTAKDAVVTKTTAIMGSPGYMSPEQMVASHTVDVRSDVWSLGIVLYELLTGRLPFTGDTMPELVARILQRPHDPIGSVRGDVPVGLQAAVDRSLSKDPAARYANVAELARALAPFGPARSEQSVERIEQVLGVAAQPVQPQGSYASVAAGAGAAEGRTFSPITSQPGAGAKAKVVVPIAVVAVVAIAVGAFLALRPSGARSKVGSGSGAASASASAPAAPSATESASASASGVASASAVASAVVSAQSASAASAATIAPLPTGGSVPTAWKAPTAHTAAPAAPSATTCHVVSYFDADGNKHFKQVCP